MFSKIGLKCALFTQTSPFEPLFSMNYAKFHCQLQFGLVYISKSPPVSTCPPKYRKKPSGGDR